MSNLTFAAMVTEKANVLVLSAFSFQVHGSHTRVVWCVEFNCYYGSSSYAGKYELHSKRGIDSRHINLVMIMTPGLNPIAAISTFGAWAISLVQFAQVHCVYMNTGLEGEGRVCACVCEQAAHVNLPLPF